MIAIHEENVNHPLATTTTKGMIGSGDKNKLNEIANYPVLIVLKNAQSITNGTTDTLLTFPTVVADTSSNWNTTTNQWTCPQTGTYPIVANIDMLNSATVNGEGRFKVYKNNTQTHRLDSKNNIAANSVALLYGSCFLNLVTGDLLDTIFVSNNASAASPILISVSAVNIQYMFVIERIK